MTWSYVTCSVLRSLNFHKIALQQHVQKDWISVTEHAGDVIPEASVQNTWHFAMPVRESVSVFPACCSDCHSCLVPPRRARPIALLAVARSFKQNLQMCILCMLPDFKYRRESKCQFITNCPSWLCLFDFLEQPTLQITVNTNLLILKVSGFLWCYQTCWLLSWLNAQSRHS